MIHKLSFIRSELLFIDCNNCIKMEYCNSTLSYPRTEETMDKLPPLVTYSTWTYLHF